MQNNIRVLVEDFAQQIVAAVEADTAARVQAALASVLGGQALALPRRRGRPPKASLVRPAPAPRKLRHKQLCPVPGCTGLAAPVFGMVCSKHKDVAKDKIKKYRADRRAAKVGKAAKAGK